MSIQNFFKSLTWTSTRRRPIRRSRQSSGFWPRLEALEDRCLLASDISFMEPIDFSTNATPGVSAAWNAAAGDQTTLLIAGSPYMPTLVDAVAVGDFNEDGNPDVAQTNVIAGSVSILLGDGHGGFRQPPIPYPVGVNPISIAVGDLNGDTHLDLAVANFGSSNVTVLRGEGNGIFRPVPVPLAPLPGSSMVPRNVAIGEFNGDGILDMAVSVNQLLDGSSVPNGQGLVAILTGAVFPGGGRIFSTTYVKVSDRPDVGCVAVGNFDGMGGADLAVGVGTSANAGDRRPDGSIIGDNVHIFLSHEGQFGLETVPDVLSGGDQQPVVPMRAGADDRILVGATPSQIAVADFDDNGHLDLVVRTGKSGDVSILMGDGEGRFEAHKVTTGGTTVAVGDFNGDTIPDLVTTNFTDSQFAAVLLGIGDGTFQPPVDFWAGESPTGVAVGDFNGDQRLDMVVASIRTDRLSLLLNDPADTSDGVQVYRDQYYMPGDRAADDRAADDRAVHHMLDVYAPPPGTVSFAGAGKPYPVVIYAHGGGGITGDKAGTSYLMRSFARQGMIAVTINYRLNPAGTVTLMEDQVADVAQAFRWVHEHAADYGGDRNNIFMYALNPGSSLMLYLITETTPKSEPAPVGPPLPQFAPHKDWLTDVGLSPSDVRGAVFVGGIAANVQPKADQRPMLLLNGDQGAEAAYSRPGPAVFYPGSIALGADIDWQIIQGRDHFTLVSNMARDGDLARAFMLDFMAKRLKFADMQVTGIVASQGQPGNVITLTATIANTGQVTAPESQSEFRLDNGTVLGLVPTPEIPAGGTATVTLNWNVAGVRGQHVITVTADKGGAVGESNEANNTATLTVTIKGNKVKNGSFEQTSSSGTAPEGWTGASTSAGTASWDSQSGSVSFVGAGVSTLIGGSPTWTSDPIAVSAGEVLALTASVQSTGASSAATVSLAYLDASGQRLVTLPALGVPLSTSGFITLQQQITVPAGTAQVRIVLTGFAAADPLAAGKVTFNNVGLFSLDAGSIDLLFAILDDDEAQWLIS